MTTCSCCNRKVGDHSDSEKYDCMIIMSDFLNWLKTAFRFFNTVDNLMKIWKEEVTVKGKTDDNL